MIEYMPALILAAQPASIPAPGSIVSTVWDMTVRGGWMMIPLALCSLVAMTIVVERLVITRRSRIVPPQLLESLFSLRHNWREARAKCQSVILAAIKARDLPRAEQEKAMAEAGERELHRVRQRMRLLSALPQTATMLGLLGTVIGMIRTFTVIAASGESLGKTERLAQGIHEAWTATAAGLIIAVPTLLAYHIIMARIDAAAAALDHAANLWLDDDASASAAVESGANTPAAGQLAAAS
jgi:biopolymer transport protein ExbB